MQYITQNQIRFAKNSDVQIVPQLTTIREIVSRSTTNRVLFSYPKRYQRYFFPWEKGKKNSYIRGIWEGKSVKDLFLIADIKQMLRNIDPKDDTKITKRFKKYLNLKIKEGFEFIVLDAQHRIKLLSEYINGSVWAKGDTPFRKVSGKLEVYIDLLDDLGDKLEDVGKKEWNKISKDIRDWYLDQPIIVGLIIKASHKSLRKLFVSTNDGIPVSDQDKRNCGDTNIVEHIRDIANHALVFDRVFTYWNEKQKTRIGRWNSGNFNIKKRGHELISSQLLLFEKIKGGDLSKKNDLDNLFFEEDNLGYTKVISSVLTNHTKNMKTLANVCEHLSKDFLSQKGRLLNLYILISLIKDAKHHHFKKQNGILKGKSYNIGDEKGFADWFWKTEKIREELDKEIPYTNSITNEIKTVINSDSYYSATHDKRIKESTEKIMDALMKDFSEELDTLLDMGWIILEGKSATESQKQTALVNGGFVDAWSGATINPNTDGTGIEYDHILHKSKGGTGKDGNLRPIKAKVNRQRSNKKLSQDV